MQPDNAATHSNLGNALRFQGKLDEAIASYQQALRLQPDYADAHSNLGNSLRDQGLIDEAIASYQRALQLKPDYAEAHLNLSMPLLLRGNFDQGWAEYEWRWRFKGFLPKGASRPPTTDRDWDGSPLRGRSILLHAEQGLGDTIQFIRYASLLKESGAARITLVCPPSLQRLLSRCPDIDQIVTGSPFPDFDVCAFLLSLPRPLGTLSIEAIPAKVPYLDCAPELVERWDARLAELGAGRPGLRVGIAWQGYPGHKGDLWRSVRLEQFAALAEHPGIHLISLQQGPGSEQLEKTPGLALPIGPELADLAETAAVIRCLDLVISVDTAVAHLAGALAAPVWLALPMVPDWRWLLERPDSPWYPTMRLFRQEKRGEWNEVFGRIKDALSAAYPP